MAGYVSSDTLDSDENHRVLSFKLGRKTSTLITCRPPPPPPPQIWRGKSPTPFFSFVTLSHLKATNFSVESISYDTIASALVSPSTLKKNNCSIRENRMWRLGEMGVCELPLASSSRAASPPPRAPVPGQAARGSHAAGRGTFAQGRRPPRAPRG